MPPYEWSRSVGLDHRELLYEKRFVCPWHRFIHLNDLWRGCMAHAGPFPCMLVLCVLQNQAPSPMRPELNNNRVDGSGTVAGADPPERTAQGKMRLASLRPMLRNRDEVTMVRHQVRRPDLSATLLAPRSQEQQGRVIIRLLKNSLHPPHTTVVDMMRHPPDHPRQSRHGQMMKQAHQTCQK